MKNVKLWKQCMAGLLGASLVLGNLSGTGAVIAYAGEDTAVIIEEETPSDVASDEMIPQADTITAAPTADTEEALPAANAGGAAPAADAAEYPADGESISGGSMPENDTAVPDDEAIIAEEPSDVPEEIGGGTAGTETAGQAADALSLEPFDGLTIESITVEDNFTDLTETVTGSLESASYAASFGSAPMLTIPDQTVTLSSSESEQIYKITPAETARYTFTSNADDSFDPYAELYDENHNSLAHDYDDDNGIVEGGNGLNFCLSYALEAGETYYLFVSDLNYETGSFQVHTETAKESFYVRQTEYDITAIPNAATTLSVDIINTGATALTYEWKKDGNDTVLETNAKFQFTAKSPETYFCTVSDSDNTKSKVITFHVSIDNHLSLSYLEYVNVLDGGNTILNVVATAADTTDITYEWSKYNYDPDIDDWIPIDGETEPSLSLTGITDNQKYQCCVTDRFGNYAYATFHVNLVSDNELELNYNYYVSLQPDNTGAELSVTPVYGQPENLMYQWYRADNPVEDDCSWTEVASPAQAGSVISLSITEPVRQHTLYRCKVYDETNYEIFSEAYFHIYVDSGLTVSYGSGSRRAWDITPEENAALSVLAESAVTDDNYKITYAWYSSKDDDEYELIADADGAAYTTKQSGYYYCEVSDTYGNSERLYFVVTVDNPDFVVNTPAKTDFTFSRVGEQATLQVDATGGLSFKWTEEDSDTIRELTETGPSLVITAGENLKKYTCIVSDAYGNEERVIFYAAVLRGTPASSMEQAVPLTAGQTAAASIASRGDSMFFKITPSVTDTYTLQSLCDYDTKAWLFDASGAELEYDDDDGDSYNFRITRALTAGTTYYLEVTTYQSSYIGSFDVQMLQGDGSCVHSYIWKVKNAATCTANGTEIQVCAKCGRPNGISRIIPAAGHRYSGWATASAATVFAAETQGHRCGVCGAYETRVYGGKLAPTIKLTATKVPLKVKQSTTKLKVSGLANGDYVVSWKSSNTKIVTVNGSGKLTAKKKTGKATIVVTLASGLKKSVSVTVQKGAVATTKISGVSKSLKLAKGKKYALKPVLTPITSLDKVKYKTSNKKVATVSSKGVIKAKGAGKAKITVQAGKKKVTVTVTVPPTRTVSITKVPAAKTIKKGKSYTLKPKRNPSNSDEKITYSSSNKKVATVNSKGKIVAKKKGKAVITVKSGKIKVRCTVTVK